MHRRAFALAAAAALVLAACSSADDQTGSTAERREIPFPYPFTTPTPPPDPTPIDGTYVREVGPDLAGPAGKCVRCPPYRLELGDTNTLSLEGGVYQVTHEMSEWESAGHFEVNGDRVVFFNDPNCPTERGGYRWQEGAAGLTLEVVEDDCAFGGLRARYLSATAWGEAGGDA